MKIKTNGVEHEAKEEMGTSFFCKNSKGSISLMVVRFSKSQQSYLCCAELLAILLVYRWMEASNLSTVII